MAHVQTAGALVAVAELPAPLLVERPSFAWSRPGLLALASGCTEVREGQLQRVLRSLEDGPALDGPGPWFGFSAFHGVPGPVWNGFAPLRFSLPALLAWSREGRHFAAAFGPDAEGQLSRALRRADPRPRASKGPTGVRVQPAGAREQWTALVQDALAEIRAGKLQKVVLARAVDFEADAPIDADALLSRLSAAYPICRAFLVRAGDAAFLGATPELLCSVDGDAARADALAGSARPGEEPALLGSGKDLREHRAVVDYLEQRLSPLSRELRIPPEPQIQQLSNVIHLRTPIEARLHNGRSAADVVAALHPTPAVCGTPPEAALEFIQRREGLDRGLYAGFVGWAGPGHAELAVALRCAVVRGNRARLFVGAGIVEGSEPQKEWEETEMKARALLGALGAR
jgi:salicylate biosynthesis isochorismate synthase